jgi:hypothetical protein
MKKKTLGIIMAVMLSIIVLSVHPVGEIGEAKQILDLTSGCEVSLDDVYDVDVSLVTPVNQQLDIHPLFQRILERFPNAFPILRQLLGLLQDV